MATELVILLWLGWIAALFAFACWRSSARYVDDLVAYAADLERRLVQTQQVCAKQIVESETRAIVAAGKLAKSREELAVVKRAFELKTEGR